MSAVKAVRFVRPHRIYNAGEVAGFDEAIADRLIAEKIAEPFSRQKAGREAKAAAGAKGASGSVQGKAAADGKAEGEGAGDGKPEGDGKPDGEGAGGE